MNTSKKNARSASSRSATDHRFWDLSPIVPVRRPCRTYILKMHKFCELDPGYRCPAFEIGRGFREATSGKCFPGFPCRKIGWHTVRECLVKPRVPNQPPHGDELLGLLKRGDSGDQIDRGNKPGLALGIIKRDCGVLDCSLDPGLGRRWFKFHPELRVPYILCRPLTFTITQQERVSYLIRYVY